MLEPKDRRTQEIYRQLMEWMEDRRLTPKPILEIPVLHSHPVAYSQEAAPVVQTVTLRFRKTRAMGEQAWVDCEDKPGWRIYYDPNWRDFLNIDELLAEAER